MENTKKICGFKTLILTLMLIVFLSQTGFAQQQRLYANNDEVMRQLSWWNSLATERLWGCDGCMQGDDACSLGASIAMANGGGCGYAYKKADYYGYLDIDDRRAANNPRFFNFDGIYDNKDDWESGIPDLQVVKESVESIRTNIDAYFIKESIWRMPPYWLNIDAQDPLRRQPNWEIWVMPCADSLTDVEYLCEWTECKISSTGPAHNCACPICPGSCPGPANPTGPPLTCVSSDCDFVFTTHPISYCENNFGESDINIGGEPSTAAGQYCCWNCHIVDRNTGAPVKHTCGPGGADIEFELNKSDTFFYFSNTSQNMSFVYGGEYTGYKGYPHRKLADGIDLNDDLLIFSMGDGSWSYPSTVHPNVLQDPDLVRDRYWKHNATNQEFKGSRPGYCSGEGMFIGAGSMGGCMEGGGRDDFGRPASKQHIPCSPCGGFDYEYKNTGNDDTDYCGSQCHNYDLRYYRQFNIDSVWVNIFKISPEIHFPLDARMKIPDTNANCLPTSPEPAKCRLANIHEGYGPAIPGSDEDSCRTGDDCIPGLVCMNVSARRALCCPLGSENFAECCRDPDTQRCLEFKFDCPIDSVIKEWKGIGEPGCEDDDDCSYIKNLKTPWVITEQHCSEGGY